MVRHASSSNGRSAFVRVGSRKVSGRFFSIHFLASPQRNKEDHVQTMYPNLIVDPLAHNYYKRNLETQDDPVLLVDRPGHPTTVRTKGCTWGGWAVGWPVFEWLGQYSIWNSSIGDCTTRRKFITLVQVIHVCKTQSRLHWPLPPPFPSQLFVWNSTVL